MNEPRTEMKCRICGGFSSAQTCHACNSSPAYLAYSVAVMERQKTEGRCADLEDENAGLRSYAELATEALTELLRQVEAFVAENGEADFYTGQAKEVLAKNPFDPLRHETRKEAPVRVNCGKCDHPMGCESECRLKAASDEVDSCHQSGTKPFRKEGDRIVIEPGALPPHLAAIVTGTIAGDFRDWPKVRSEVLDFIGTHLCGTSRHQVNRERTDADYAIEHAGYLAQAAAQFLDTCNALDGIRLAIEEADSDEAEADATASLEGAQEAYSEGFGSVRTAIYEFEKRRDRALQSVAGKKP